MCQPGWLGIVAFYKFATLDHARHLHRGPGNLGERTFAGDAIAEFPAVESNHHRSYRGFDEADIIDYTPIRAGFGTPSIGFGGRHISA